MAANDPYAGVTLIAAPGTDPYAGVTGRQVANPTGPADMGPQMAPPSALENFGRTLYGDVAAPGIAAQSAVGGLAGSAAHLAGAVASDTGLAAPGAGARWDAAAQRYLAPPAPESPQEAQVRNAPAAIMDPRYNPITGAAQAAGNALDQHLPAGAEHVIGDYLVPGANLASIFLGPEAAERGGLTRPPLAEGAPGTESAIARAPNDVADAAELGKSPSLTNKAAQQGGGQPAGPLSTLAENATGRTGYANDIAVRNEARVNAGINYDLGIPPGTPTSRNAIMTAQIPLKRGFNQLENIPGQIALDQGFHSDMGGIGTNLATLPNTPGVDELREIAGKPGSVDAPTLIQTVQTARARGSALMNSDDPAQVELGKAYLGTARAYENQFSRYLQANPQFGVDPQAWDQLRTGWAKNQLALEAYKGGESGGSYDAKVFANAGGKNGEPLTGWMRVIGDLQPQAPQNFALGKAPTGMTVPILGGGVGSLLTADMAMRGELGKAATVAGATTAIGAGRSAIRRAALGPTLNPAEASARAAEIAKDPRLSYYFAARDRAGVPAPGAGPGAPGATGVPMQPPGGPPQIPGAIATPGAPYPPGAQFNPDAYANAVTGGPRRLARE